MKYRLDIYQVIDGTDDWPLIDVIDAETAAECLEIADRIYPNNDRTHWTNPYVRVWKRL